MVDDGPGVGLFVGVLDGRADGDSDSVGDADSDSVGDATSSRSSRSSERPCRTGEADGEAVTSRSPSDIDAGATGDASGVSALVAVDVVDGSTSWDDKSDSDEDGDCVDDGVGDVVRDGEGVGEAAVDGTHRGGRVGGNSGADSTDDMTALGSAEAGGANAMKPSTRVAEQHTARALRPGHARRLTSVPSRAGSDPLADEQHFESWQRTWRPPHTRLHIRSHIGLQERPLSHSEQRARTTSPCHYAFSHRLAQALRLGNAILGVSARRKVPLRGSIPP